MGTVELMLNGPRRRVELCGEETQISPRCESAHWPRVSGFAMATCTPGKSYRMKKKETVRKLSYLS